MPIEFRCTNCRQLMRTPDDAAGKQAKCPQCNTLVRIPAVSTSSSEGEGAAGEMDQTLPHPSGASGTPSASMSGGSSDAGGYNLPPPPPPSARSGEADTNPYQAPAAYAPAAEATMAVGRRPIVPTRLDLGIVLTRTWEIFRVHWLMCALVVFVVQILVQMFSFASGLVMGPLVIIGNEVGIVLAQVLSQLLTQLFALWLNLGMTIFFLKTARGQDYQFADVFRGHPFLLHGALAYLLMGLMIILPIGICVSPSLILLATVGQSPEFWAALAVGVCVAIVPAMYLSLTFWPCVTLVVDQDVDAIEALRLARLVTRGNKLWILLMFFVASGLGVLGFLACCVGVFVTSGYTMLMFIVAYLAMTGQPTAETLAYTAETPPGIGPAVTEPPGETPLK